MANISMRPGDPFNDILWLWLGSGGTLAESRAQLSAVTPLLILVPMSQSLCPVLQGRGEKKQLADHKMSRSAVTLITLPFFFLRSVIKDSDPARADKAALLEVAKWRRCCGAQETWCPSGGSGALISPEKRMDCKNKRGA